MIKYTDLAIMNEADKYKELAGLLKQLAREGVFSAPLSQLIKEAREYWKQQDQELRELKCWLMRFEMNLETQFKAKEATNGLS